MPYTINLTNSIWPNGVEDDTNGYAVFKRLGVDKIQVPTDSAEWPKGDKLVSPFVYQDDKLVGFCDTKAMTVNGQTSITLNYKHIEADFSSIEEGMLTITAPNATFVKYTWANSSSSDTGNSGDTVVLGTKYINCSTLDEVKAVDPDYLTNDVVDGAWTQSLANLTDSTSMFFDCDELESFSSDLSKLTSGNSMFYHCSNLTTFSSDLSSLTVGEQMFYLCTNLTTFNADLSSLTNGSYMFYRCKLDTASVQNIADTINTPASKRTIHIEIGNFIPNEQEEEAFNTIASKNWKVYVSVNGGNESQWTPTATTPIDGEQTVTPIPFWAKPVQSDEEHAHYVDEQGNYYNILGGNFIYGDSLETYGMFISEENAAANMRLTKI